MGIQSTWERRESTEDPDVTFLGVSTPVITATAWVVNCTVLQLLLRPLCFAQVMQKGLLDEPSSEIWGALFMGRLLVETQKVTELCGFRKGTSILDLQCTVSAFPAH